MSDQTVDMLLSIGNGAIQLRQLAEQMEQQRNAAYAELAAAKSSAAGLAAQLEAVTNGRNNWESIARELQAERDALAAANQRLTSGIVQWVAALDHHQEVYDADSSDVKKWHRLLNRAEMQRQLAEDALRALLAEVPATVCPDCLQSAPTPAEIAHGEDCEATP